MFEPPNGWNLVKTRDHVLPSYIEIWSIDSSFRDHSTFDLLKIRLEKENIDLTIEKDRWGKPFLPNSTDWSFNCSHTTGITILAISRGNRIGVDVESVTTRSSINNITERYFSDSENEIIRKFSQKSRDRIFYRIWAFKEAAIKAASLGSEISVDSVLVDLTHNNKLNLDKKSRILENFSNLKLLELELDDPFVGFIAIIG